MRGLWLTFDIIVCWRQNWPECPLEAIELKGLVKRLG
jgi:hypothetical protein